MNKPKVIYIITKKHSSNPNRPKRIYFLAEYWENDEYPSPTGIRYWLHPYSFDAHVIAFDSKEKAQKVMLEEMEKTNENFDNNFSVCSLVLI